ncbi:grasp-with-spasm system SPASM domain peptide maturase [Tenacibaculum discolor]|uniref:Grasp-with-spasm system SPASM domain peptide maturase n=1 Tax=Tenacibaculum discolor TaxID=361581 RepID=A0A2G1BVX6_9FLAO|nr:grasp-with-spasm system SPASM domain peptide maturase [Tenacibaculum discolor]MDP2540237.1 grasp-with-spasm system SPASM domain peptide maturase [Tenacibaculum discolor]PHN98180.1 grasp-with-spasm system SPASM domain peptide maturase [Tenacibaculum discolor]PHO01817.1 grasp-with-spasm system SPASM domain peptide maturase [Rhodobacteraceae bacterium 4F10]
MNNSNKYVRMFSNCIPVLGKDKSVIYDLQRKQMFNIPNDLYSFIQLFEEYTISEIFELCGKDNEQVVEEYLQFLTNKELTFLIDKEELELFPKLSMKWTFPAKISNAIIEISEITYPLFEKILAYLTALGCEYLYLKIDAPKSFLLMKDIMEKLTISSIFSVVFETPFNEGKKITDYEQLIVENKRIETIFLLSDEQLKTSSSKILITSPKQFVNKKEYFFKINISLFTESQKYNTYFNKKIFINKEGGVLNAPETEELFGNITRLKLKELEAVVDSEQFQKYWSVNKDVIDECKDCELRYMCVDNRVPKQSKEGSYFFTSKCELRALN